MSQCPTTLSLTSGHADLAAALMGPAVMESARPPRVLAALGMAAVRGKEVAEKERNAARWVAAKDEGVESVGFAERVRAWTGSLGRHLDARSRRPERAENDMMVAVPEDEDELRRWMALAGSGAALTDLKK